VSEVLVLCYHAVSQAWPAALSVTPEALERQLGYLVRRGWRGATFREAVLRPSHPRTIAVTFDDAYSSVKEYAVPILTSLGLPATVFAASTCVSSEQRLSFEGVEHWQETPYADELLPMSWEDLGSLAEGGWEIGSHSRTHPHLPRLDEQDLKIELEGSREEVSIRLGGVCDTIAYPYGDVDDRVAAAAERAGYLAGASLSSQLTPRGALRWPRVGIYHVDKRAWRFRLKVARPVRQLRATPLWRRLG